MAEKVSVKTASAIFLLCTVILALCACVDPVNINDFLNDPDVIIVIESTKEKVELSPDSDIGLTGGNRIITGLNPTKYYMVEKEIDKNGATVTKDPAYPWFVTEYSNGGGSLAGILKPDLELITRISGQKINDPTNLTNLNTYTVKSAKKFDPESFYYSINSGAPTPISVEGGIITIIAPEGANISLENLSPDYDDYEVMAVAVSPPTLNQTTSPFKGSKSKIISTTVSKFALEGVNTTVDYVFFKKATSPIFKVLTVKIEKAIYEISIKEGTTNLENTKHNFTAQVDYSAITPLTVTVTNTGNQDTGDLTATLSGLDSSAFKLTDASISNIGKNGSTNFTVVPITGLGIGNYTATVTVSGSKVTSPKKFDVAFTVYNSGGQFANITFSYKDEIDALIPTSSIGKLKRGNYDGTLNVVINFDTGAASWSDFKWMIDNTDVTSKMTNVRRLIIDNNLNGDFGALLGTNSFNVSVSAVLGEKRYSKMITILVED